MSESYATDAAATRDIGPKCGEGNRGEGPAQASRQRTAILGQANVPIRQLLDAIAEEGDANRRIAACRRPYLTLEKRPARKWPSAAVP